MKRWLGVGILVVAIATVLVVKWTRSSPGASPPASSPAPRVLLYADLREIDEHGCGDIIKAVRAAGDRGIATRENDAALAKLHHVTIEPTVVILSADGKEQARFEGESDPTIDAVRTALAKLAP